MTDVLTINDRAGVYPPSYYATVNPPLAPFPPLHGSRMADVCVIGAGFTGLSAARTCAAAGLDTVVLEAQRVGFGASGRNGGQVGQGQRRDVWFLERIMGRDRARALFDIARDAVSHMRDLANEMDVPLHDGIIHADHKPRLVADSHAYAEKLAADYAYDLIRPLDRAALRDLVASDAYHGGSLDLGGGHLDPLRFALALARSADAAGAHIHEGARVTEIRPGDPALIRTDGGEIRARHVILACNGYLGDLSPHVAARVAPINNYILTTEPMSPARRETLIRNNHAVADSKFVVNYFRFTDDHRLLFGGTESGGLRFPEQIGGQVRRAMLSIFPQTRDLRIDHAWGGTLAITMNRLPHFARLAPNMLTCSGYSGHGVALATYGGRIAAQAVLGRAGRFDAMAAIPTTPFPGGARFRQGLLRLALFWYGLRDRL